MQRKHFVVRSLIIGIAALIAIVTAPAAAQAAPYIGPGGTTGATMKFSPAKATAVRGSTVALKVVVDTTGDTVNAVQIVLAFPDARLDCAGISPATTWSFVAATECTSSTAKIAVGSPLGSSGFTGRATAATITFRATNLTGKAAVTFAPDGAVGGGCLVVATGGVNVLGPTNRAVITVT